MGEMRTSTAATESTMARTLLPQRYGQNKRLMAQEHKMDNGSRFEFVSDLIAAEMRPQS
jgi:hypothetical protein